MCVLEIRAELEGEMFLEMQGCWVMHWIFTTLETTTEKEAQERKDGHFTRG